MRLRVRAHTEKQYITSNISQEVGRGPRRCLVVKNTCHQAWWPILNIQDPQIFICRLQCARWVHPHKPPPCTHTHTQKLKCKTLKDSNKVGKQTDLKKSNAYTKLLVTARNCAVINSQLTKEACKCSRLEHHSNSSWIGMAWRIRWSPATKGGGGHYCSDMEKPGTLLSILQHK